MLERIRSLTSEATAAIEAAPSAEAVEALKAAWLGRSGRFQEVLRALGSLPGPERGPVGKAANDAKEHLAALLEVRLTALRASDEASVGDREWVAWTGDASAARWWQRPPSAWCWASGTSRSSTPRD